MKTFQEFINEESVEDVEDFSQLVNQAKVDKLSKEEIEAVLKKAGAKKEIIVDLLQKYTTNATNEGALEDVKTKQAAYEAIAKEVEKSKEFRALITKITDLAQTIEKVDGKSDWAIAGIISRLDWDL